MEGPHGRQSVRRQKLEHVPKFRTEVRIGTKWVFEIGLDGNNDIYDICIVQQMFNVQYSTFNIG